jgi:hypothetical protein
MQDVEKGLKAIMKNYMGMGMNPLEHNSINLERA